MLSHIVLLAEDLPGLEKTLRLFQNLSTIGVGLAQSKTEVRPYLVAQSQLALSRRYFRLLKWHPTWKNGLASVFRFGHASTLQTLLEVCRATFLGLYFFLEMFTITNAMGVTSYPWADRLQVEANKCWFYGLVFAIMLSLYQIFLAPAPPPPAKDKHAEKKHLHHKAARPPAPQKNTAAVYQQLIVDACDLFIPGSALGWIPVGPLVVGSTSAISTTVSGRQIWLRLQREQASKHDKMKTSQIATTSSLCY